VMFRALEQAEQLPPYQTGKTVAPISNLRALECLNFFKADAQSTFGPYLAIYLLSVRHWRFDQIGLAMAIPGIVTIVAQTPAGALVDGIRRKRELAALAAGVIAAACLQVVYAHGVTAVVLAQVLFSSAAIVLPPAIAALTMGLVGPHAFAQQMGRNEMISHAGAVAGAIGAGAIGYWLGQRSIFHLAAMMSLGAAGAAMAIRGADIDHSLARESVVEPGGKEHIAALKDLVADRRIMVFGASVILFHLANAAMLPLVSEMLSRRQPGLAALYASACVLMAQAVMVPVAWIAGRRAASWGRKPVFVVAFAALPIRAVLFALLSKPCLLVSAQAIDGISAGIFGVVAVVTMADLARGTGRFNLLQGAIATCVAIGGSLSNLTAGFIVQRAGFRAGFVSLGAIALVGLVFFCLAMPETRPADE
jgi:MFS family permease